MYILQSIFSRPCFSKSYYFGNESTTICYFSINNQHSSVINLPCTVLLTIFFTILLSLVKLLEIAFGLSTSNLSTSVFKPGESNVSLKFCFLYLFFVHDPQVLYANPGCLRCTSDKNLFAANKNLLKISFILNIFK